MGAIHSMADIDKAFAERMERQEAARRVKDRWAAENGAMLIPPDVLEQRVSEDIRAHRERCTAWRDDHDARVRGVILANLERLADDLGQFEQTTHGAMLTGRIEDVSRELADAFREPTAFNVSNLSQAIRGMVKHTETK